jgi:hypoxanthine-DNA glycosylase
MAEPLFSFPPIADSRARILLLGSMPGRQSLQAQAYYAHPQNAFWWIMQQLFGAAATASYAERCHRLMANGVALWDVMHSCVRPGSLDADIENDSIVANDFATFFSQHPNIQSVYFNGAKAEASYRRHVMPCLTGRLAGLHYQRLPSTSPAYAAMRRAEKLAVWRSALAAGLGEVSA